MLRSESLALRLRIVPALLALAANLLAAGVPLLHAAAHWHAEESHHAAVTSAIAVAEHADHEHDAVHTASLHDDATPQSRSAFSDAVLASPDLAPLAAVPHARRDSPIPVPLLLPRAPPPGDPARAPPLG